MPDPQYNLPDVTDQISKLPYDDSVKDALYDAFYADSLQSTEQLLRKANVPDDVRNVFYQVRAKSEKGKPYDRNLQSLQAFYQDKPSATAKVDAPATSDPPVSKEKPTDYSGFMGGIKSFGSGLLKGAVENTAKSIYEMGKRVLPADETDTEGRITQMVAGPAGPLVMDLVKSQIGQFGKAYDAARAGQPLEAGGQLVAGMIPLFGPPIAAASEKLGTAAASGNPEAIGEAVGELGVAAIPAIKTAKTIARGKSGKPSGRSPAVTETAPPPKSAKASAAVFQDKAATVSTERPPMKQLPEGKSPRFYADESGKTLDTAKPVMEVSDVAPTVEPVMSPVGTQLQSPASPTRMIAPPIPKGQPEPSRFTAPEKGPIIDTAIKDPVSLIDDLSSRLERAATPEQRAAIAQELRSISQSMAEPTAPPVAQIEAPRPQAQLPAPSPEGTAMAKEMSTTGRITPLDPPTMKFAQSAPTEQLIQYVEYGERALASGVIMDPQAFVKAQIQLNTVKNELANRGEIGTFELMPNQPQVSTVVPSAPASKYPVERNAARTQTIDAVSEPVVEAAPTPAPAPPPKPVPPPTPKPAATPAPAYPVVAPTVAEPVVAAAPPVSTPRPTPTPSTAAPATPVSPTVPVEPPPVVASPVVAAPPRQGKPPKTKTTEPPPTQPVAPVVEQVVAETAKPNSEIGVTITEVVPKNGKVAYRDPSGLSGAYTPEKGEVVFKAGDGTYGAIRRGDKVMLSDIINDPEGNTAIMIPFKGDLASSVADHLGASYKPASTTTPPVKSSKPKEIKADNKTILPTEETQPKKKVETQKTQESATTKTTEDPYAGLSEADRTMFELLDSVEGTSEHTVLKKAMDSFYESLEVGEPSRRALDSLAQAMRNARKISEKDPTTKATGSIYVKRGQDAAKVVGPNGDTIGSLELIRKSDGTVKVLVFDAKSNKLGDSVLSILNDKALATVAKEYLGKN